MSVTVVVGLLVGRRGKVEKQMRRRIGRKIKRMRKIRSRVC